MGSEQVLKPAGMVTSPNPLSAAPRGAMREALNVVLRRDGILEPRPGFNRRTLQTVDDPPEITELGIPRRIIPWQDSALYVGSDESIFASLEDGGSGSDEYITGLTFAGLASGFAARAVDTRGNLYVTAADGLRKLTSTTATAALPVGISGRRSTIVNATPSGTGNGFLATGKQAAYRVTFRRSDDNGVIVTSSPTAPMIATGTGVADEVTVETLLDTETVAEGDVLQAWRSTSQDAVASDSLFLVYEVTITSAMISAKLVSFTDYVLDANLGEALYTNDSVEGALQTNDPPPRVQDVTLFRNCVFGADITGRKTAILRWNFESPNVTGSATKIGTRTATADTTNLSTGLTSVSSNTGWAVGMLISGTGIPQGTRITAVGSGTATMSAAATADGTGVAVAVYDTLQFDGDYFRASEPDALVAAINIGTVSSVFLSSSGNPSEHFRAYLASTSYDVYASGKRPAVVVIESIDPASDAVLGINATHPTEWSPALTAIATAHAEDADYVDPANIINGVIYSKPDQPESFPAINVIRVGSSSHRVDRILATRDALWIFKRDGVFRLTGTFPNWRVDPFDMTHFLVATDSAVVLNEAIYAWTNRGVVRIADSGITQISELSIGNILGPIERVIGQEQINSYESDTLTSGWAIANLKANEYILAVPAIVPLGGEGGNTPVPSELPAYLYVWNTVTLSWTRWLFRAEIYHGCIGSQSQQMVLAVTEYNVDDDDHLAALTIERDPSNADQLPLNADYSAEIGNGDVTVTWNTTDDANVFEIELSDEFPNYTPTVGDLIKAVGGMGDGEDFAIVTDVADSENFTIYFAGDDSQDLDVLVFYECFQSAMEFVAKIDGNAATEKSWQGGAVSWGTTQFLRQYALSFTSSLIASAVSTTLSADEWPDNTTDVAQLARYWVPRNHARAGVLYPKVTVQQAGSPWQMYGMTLTAVSQTVQVRR